MKKSLSIVFVLAAFFIFIAPAYSLAAGGNSGNLGGCFGPSDCAPGTHCDLSISTCVADSGAAPGGGNSSTGTASGTLGGLINQVITLINLLVPLVFAIAFIVFLFGVFQYFIAGAGNDEKRKEGRNFIMYALIGFVVMVSVWGLVNLLSGSFTFGSSTRPNLPTF